MAIEQKLEFNLFPEYQRGLSIFQYEDGGDRRQKYQAWSKDKTGLVTTTELCFGPEYASIHNATWGVFADSNQGIYLAFLREENFEAGILLEFDNGIWKPEETTVSINGLEGVSDYTSTFTQDGIKIRDQQGHDVLRIVSEEDRSRFLVEDWVTKENFIVRHPQELMEYLELLDNKLEEVRDWREVSYAGLKKLRQAMLLLANKFLVDNDRISEIKARKFLENLSLN